MADFTSPAVQAMNLIRYIGDEVSKSGEPIRKLPENIHEIIYAPTPTFADQLIQELWEKGVIQMPNPIEHRGFPIFRNLNLTLQGWEEYEAEKRGRIAGNNGFIAMKFDAPELERFVEDVVKPTVNEGTGYGLVDMRDVTRAGIIDNIMRVQIRDAKFVIADLTHDNNGAYWEAGYAEGLGKPVIYICKKEKFDETKTHFDTNHCTTILWSKDDEESFRRELIATLRRSLEQSS